MAISITTVNHVAIDIEASADIVWRAILDEYVEARKFRELGFSIEPLNPVAHPFGGYRMRLEQDGAVLDDRIFHITERDDAMHRLSLFAHYVSRLDGIVHVYATYHAQETAKGTRYAIDCHASVAVEGSPGDAGEPAADTVTAKKMQFDKDLLEYLESIKAKIENA